MTWRNRFITTHTNHVPKTTSEGIIFLYARAHKTAMHTMTRTDKA
jgi:hypothetical protein